MNPIHLAPVSRQEHNAGACFPGSPITRRNFLKRTGLATVAWHTAGLDSGAQSNYFQVGSKTPDWAEHILMCSLEPAASDYKSTWFIKDTSHPNWSSIPHVDISASVGVEKNGKLRCLVDEDGEGYSFFLLHWLTYGAVLHKGDFVGACKPGGKLTGTIQAHVAVVQGKWAERKAVSEASPSATARGSAPARDFVYRTLLKASADPDTGEVGVTGGHPNERIRIVNSGGKRTQWLPLVVDKVTTGWVRASSSWFCVEPSADGLSCGLGFSSLAEYIPSSSLETKDVHGKPSDPAPLPENPKLKFPPLAFGLDLRWDFAIWKTSLGLQIEKGPALPPPRDVASDLPPRPGV